MKCRPAVGAAAEPSPFGVHRLVALGIAQRLRDVRRQRRLALGRPVEPQAPAALSEVLQELDRSQTLAGLQPPRRTSEPLPLPGPVQRLEQEHLRFAPAGPLQTEPRRNDTRVVDDDELAARSSSGRSRKRRCRTSPVDRCNTSSLDSSRRVAGCCAISSGGSEYSSSTRFIRPER